MQSAHCFLWGLSKDGSLIRKLSSNAALTIYPCTVFRQPLPLPEAALTSLNSTVAGPLPTALYTTEKEG